MSTDPLSDIVRSLNLTGAVFLQADLTAPWAISAHVTEDDCRPFMPIPRQVIAFHVVVEGDVLLSMDDGAGYRPHRTVRAGEVIFLPHNPGHVLASGTGLVPHCGDDLLLPGGDDALVRIRHGGGGAQTRLLCGFVASDSGATPLLDTLPEVLVIGIESLATRQWIEASALMAAREFTEGRLTHKGSMARLSDLLLTEALRAHIEQSPEPPGWLGGIAHPNIGRALARIHAALDDPPTVEDLAHEAGMSRSAFVERFTEAMGASPRRYILTQRMELAAALLNDGVPVAQIAARVGYEAPEAFSRAFKREVGLAPADWRSAQDAA
ncbi:MAG: AraC family transcriptional regulator [Pseudomonadota bacterium]